VFPAKTHEDPLGVQEYPRLFILLCLPSKFQQLRNGRRLALAQMLGAVNPSFAHFATDVELFMRTHIELEATTVRRSAQKRR
jgi:hypothetical protein